VVVVVVVVVVMPGFGDEEEEEERRRRSRRADVQTSPLAQTQLTCRCSNPCARCTESRV